jgi:hypothetical protein
MRTISFGGVVRALLLLAVTALPVLGVVDGGSIGYARLSTEDDARTVALAAAQAVRGEPLTQQTALTAYRTASATASRFGATVAQKDFTVHGDGSVTLTLSRKAPTVVVGRLPFLRDRTAVSATVTVEPSPYT